MYWSLPTITGIVYFIYSIVNKSKINIYNKYKNVNDSNRELFLKYQLVIAVLSSILSIAIGIVMLAFDLNMYFIFLSPILISLSNELLRLKS